MLSRSYLHPLPSLFVSSNTESAFYKLFMVAFGLCNFVLFTSCFDAPEEMSGRGSETADPASGDVVAILDAGEKNMLALGHFGEI